MRSFRRLAVVAVLALIASCTGGDDPLGTSNNFANPFNPVIASVPVVCTAFDGQPVATIPDPTITDIGYARQGSPPVIVLNSRLLETLPPALQLFWYGHECAHHVLGHTVFTSFGNEAAADCWSIRTGRDQGLFDRTDVEGFAPYFLANPGSPWGHLPGPQRQALFLQCYDTR